MTYLTDIFGGFLSICREGRTNVRSQLTGTSATSTADATVTGTGTKYLTEVKIGDELIIGSVTGQVLSITSDTALELTANAGATVAATIAYKVSDASAADRPVATVPANWDRLADVENFEWQPKLETEEVMKPSESGGYHRKKKITKKADLDLVVTVNDFTELITELVLLASGAIVDEFEPMSGDGLIRAWFKLDMRNQAGQVVLQVIVWGELSAETLGFGNAVPKPKLTIAVLKNAKNTGVATLDPDAE